MPAASWERWQLFAASWPGLSVVEAWASGGHLRVLCAPRCLRAFLAGGCSDDVGNKVGVVAEYTARFSVVSNLYVDVYWHEQVPPVPWAFGWGMKNSGQPAECFLWCLLCTELCAWHNLLDNNGSKKFTATKRIIYTRIEKQTFQMFWRPISCRCCGKCVPHLLKFRKGG